MELNIFKKIIRAKKEKEKYYAVICSTKDVCMSICYLAERYNFKLDGVIVIDQQNLMKEEFSNVPLLDFKESSLPIKQCVVMYAVPNEHLNVMNQLQGLGFNAYVQLTNADINEVMTQLYQHNFILDKVKTAYKSKRLNQTWILDYHCEEIMKLLHRTEFKIDGILAVDDEPNDMEDSLLIAVIDNVAQNEMLNEVYIPKFGYTLPLYANDMLALKFHLQLQDSFYNMLEWNNAPDYVARYEARAKDILNAYDVVNITSVDAEDNLLMSKSLVMSLSKVDKKILHAIVPLNHQKNGIANLNRGGGIGIC